MAKRRHKLSDQSALAHHFDDLDQQHAAGSLGMWVFLVTEIMFFGGLFLGYTIYRWQYTAAFITGSRELDIVLGGINTVILIASSLTMALAVFSAQTGRKKALILFLILTMLLGAGFLGIKYVEYHHKWEENHIPGRSFSFEGAPREVQLFFSFYFAMTGMHALHMIIGLGLLAVLVYGAVRGRYTPEHNAPVDITGLYWHFVDIVWIFLFPLLYLIDRA
jgi:cytochrome c oxidase subunit 3